MRFHWLALSALLLTNCGQEAPVPVDPLAEQDMAPDQQALGEAASGALSGATEMPIQRVDSLMVSRLNGREDVVLILAAGSVESEGWTEARLEPVEPGAEETTRSFTFVATSPEGAVTGLQPQTVEARLEIEDLPPEVELVRIVAATNELSAFVGN